MQGLNIMNFEMLNKFLFVFFLLFIICSCNEEEPTAPTEENLLLSNSFEKNGQPSSEGWTLPSGSEYSTNVPPNGGSYSLVLEATQPPEEYAFIKVPVKTEYTIDQLTFWAFSSGVSSNIYGRAILSVVRNGSMVKSRSIVVDGIVWKNYSIRDTFNVAAGDSVYCRSFPITVW
jgi:hypothetical protein